MTSINNFKKKQIVFVNQSSGYLMLDIIHAFSKEYESTVLITGLLNQRGTLLDNNVKVEKLIKYNRTSTIKRLYTWSLAFFKALYLIKLKYRNSHLFIVSNPPFATLIPLFCKNSFDVLIYDIYPDALVEFKVLNPKSFWVKSWENANTKLYKRANNIFTITNEMKTRLSKYVSKEKIKVVPIWTDNKFLKPIPKTENKFLKELQLENKFIIMYSGNLGKTHPIEVLLELAENLINNIEIQFLIIGGGDKFGFLSEKIEEMNLKNVLLLPLQDMNMLPYTLTAADIGVVTLGEGATDLSIPSKTYSLMSVGMPILCIANKNAALSKLIEKEQIGKVFEKEEKNAMLEFILDCKNNTLNHEKYQLNSLKASLNYTSENAKLFIR